jgi:hypothetical protein
MNLILRSSSGMSDILIRRFLQSFFHRKSIRSFLRTSQSTDFEECHQRKARSSIMLNDLGRGGRSIWEPSERLKYVKEGLTNEFYVRVCGWRCPKEGKEKSTITPFIEIFQYGT